MRCHRCIAGWPFDRQLRGAILRPPTNGGVLIAPTEIQVEIRTSLIPTQTVTKTSCLGIPESACDCGPSGRSEQSDFTSPTPEATILAATDDEGTPGS